MNISYGWLKEYVTPLPAPQQLSDILTSLGLETGGMEEVETIKGGLRGLVIARVLTCEAHPDSDHLHVTTVDAGPKHGVLQVVCGAPNVAAGQTVVLATVGTTLYDGDKELKIKRSKIRGTESYGMICAEDEIGIGTSHAGIIVIDDPRAIPGMPAAEYYGITADTVLEVDLTPNRIDAASHYGVARDLAARLRYEGADTLLSRPSVEAFALDNADGGITVTVDDRDGCIRYSGITVRGVHVAESPDWLRNRLTAIGLRPINNVVDITNYILHGFGQPLHAFDADKIEGGRVVVRQATQGEPFVTLDGVEHTLDAADMMICSATRPMCIAGVFGGLDSGVTEGTTNVFIESACFNPSRVRKTARRHGLSTDSSFRFERGVDPNNTVYILKLAAIMVQQLCGGTIVGPITDIYPEPVAPYRVPFSIARCNALIGKEILVADIERILSLLEIRIVDRDGDNLTLDVPTYRYDVRRECDVVEEILRIYGYNNVEEPGQIKASLQYKSPTDEDEALRETVSNYLSANGYNEILNNSLTAESYYADSQAYPADTCVRLLNPLSGDLSVMRRTLLYGGLRNISYNINRRNESLALYEWGNVYEKNPALEPTDEAPLKPYHEEARLGLWLTGDLRPGNWARPAQPATIYDLRGYVDNVLALCGIPQGAVVIEQHAAGELYSASLTLSTRSGKLLAVLGTVSQALLSRFDIKQEVCYADILWPAVVKLALKQNVTFAPLPRTQAVRRDLALLLDEAVTLQQVEAAVRSAERRLLQSVELFDVYQGKNLPAGKKSYAIAIMLQDPEKTLQEKLIEAVMDKIVATLKKELGAELR